MKVVLAVLALACSSQAFLFGNTDWGGLESPWNVNLVAGFSNRPRNLNSDNMNGYVMKENYCNNKGSPFVGQAYWKGNDPTLVLLFDKNGYIAGVQNFLDASSYTPPTSAIGKSMIKYGNYWVMTALFVDPNIVCTTGRTAAQYKSQGTGDRLNFQVGPDPTKASSIMNIPRDQNQLANTMWTEGKCFYTMGQHYWYNLSAGMDCNNFFPYCILYNQGKLDAFCFASNANLNSNNFDSPHPSPKVLSQFMKPVPNCMNANSAHFSTYSTIHVYMTDSPRSSFC